MTELRELQGLLYMAGKKIQKTFEDLRGFIYTKEADLDVKKVEALLKEVADLTGSKKGLMSFILLLLDKKANISRNTYRMVENVFDDELSGAPRGRRLVILQKPIVIVKKPPKPPAEPPPEEPPPEEPPPEEPPPEEPPA